MAKVYWIATYRSVKYQEALDAYAKLAGPAIWSAGGRNLVRGVPAKTLEEGLNMRTVVIVRERRNRCGCIRESRLSGRAEGFGRRRRQGYSHCGRHGLVSLSLPRVERVAQAVADKVKRQHH